jgi:hypothetical protein
MSPLAAPNASDFLPSGVVRCARCGKAYVGMSARGNGGRYEYCACSGARSTDRGLPQRTPPSAQARTRRPAAVCRALPRRRSRRGGAGAGRTGRRVNPAGDRAAAGLNRRRDHPRRAGARSATTRPSSREGSPPNALRSGAARRPPPSKPNSPHRRRTRPDRRRRRPISQPSQTNSRTVASGDLPNVDQLPGHLGLRTESRNHSDACAGCIVWSTSASSSV